MNKRTIVTLTGPSCAGKSTLEKMLVKELGFANLVSNTTRQPRENEVDGVNYYFNTKEQFTDMKNNGELIELVEFGNEYYGLSVKEFTRVSDMGKTVVVVVEPSGRAQIEEYCRLHGIVFVPIFVNSSPDDIAIRFLTRHNANYETHRAGMYLSFLKGESKRLAAMLTTERAWVREANEQPSVNPYMLVIRQFDEDTEKLAIIQIDVAVKLMQDSMVLTNE